MAKKKIPNKSSRKKKKINYTSKRKLVGKNSNSGKKELDETTAIIGLLVNVLLFPGLGTVISGKIKTGIWQIVLLAAGIILQIFSIGIPIIVAAWIWALISSIKILQNVL